MQRLCTRLRVEFTLGGDEIVEACVCESLCPTGSPPPQGKAIATWNVLSPDKKQLLVSCIHLPASSHRSREMN